MSETVHTGDQSTHVTKPPFKASEPLAQQLQRLHVDLIDLHLVGKQAHWNVVGKNFRDLHLQLDEIVDAARDFSDEIAERMRALFIVPDGRAGSVAQQSSIAEFPSDEVDTAETADLITAALYAVSGTARDIRDDVDAEDPATADLLHGIIVRLEQFAWFVDSENRIANRSIPRPIQQ